MTYYWTVAVRVGEQGTHTYQPTAPTEYEAAERAIQEALDEWDPGYRIPERDIEAIRVECDGMVGEP